MWSSSFPGDQGNMHASNGAGTEIVIYLFRRPHEARQIDETALVVAYM